MRKQHPEVKNAEPRPYTLSKKRKAATNDGRDFAKGGRYALTKAERKRSKLIRGELDSIERTLAVAKNSTKDKDRPNPEKTIINTTRFEAWEHSTLESPFMSHYNYNGTDYVVSAGGTWAFLRDRGELIAEGGVAPMAPRAVAKIVRETWLPEVLVENEISAAEMAAAFKPKRKRATRPPPTGGGEADGDAGQDLQRGHACLWPVRPKRMLGIASQFDSLV
jgi:hypothetical protein